MISVKDKKADKESMKERFGGEGGPSFLYEDGRVKAVRKTPHRSLLSIYCALMDTDCPSLPKVLSIEATAKSLTVVEEYIPGRTLQQVIDQRQGAEKEKALARICGCGCRTAVRSADIVAEQNPRYGSGRKFRRENDGKCLP